MNIAGLVILYNPGNNVTGNIKSFHSFIKHLYIIDNSEGAHKEIIDELKTLPNCTFLHDGENKGIAARLNQGCMLAMEQGYNGLLTMDQDSFFSPNNITGYFDCIVNYPEKNKVAMWGIQFENPKNQSGSCHSEKVLNLITSGSVINLDVFPRLGGFDEKLFIDEVDSEYCYRASLQEFETIQFKNIFLDHNLGEKSYHKSFKNLKRTARTLHPPVRLYYMTRNFFYIRSKYKKKIPEAVNLSKKALLNRIKNNLLYNRQRIQIFKSVCKGYFDFRRKIMGKYKDAK